jgi:2-hydroxycyclohexanecarboxyl-CoA dehydrogenase
MPDPGSTHPRTALITGAAGGIGAAIALELAEQGHDVIVADIRDDKAHETAKTLNALAVHLDVTKPSSVHQAIQTATAQRGRIDILVNAAGWDELRPFVETDEAFWDRLIEINFKGCLRTCRAVVPGMIERSYGRIVNISSDAARVGSSLESVYAGAKGAVISFTKTLARETARHGVTANVVCPGPTDTPLLRGMTEAGGEKLVDALTRAVPMRRLGQPEDIAAAVAFFASDRAGYITGQTLSVSGGLTMA